MYKTKMLYLDDSMTKYPSIHINNVLSKNGKKIIITVVDIYYALKEATVYAN